MANAGPCVSAERQFGVLLGWCARSNLGPATANEQQSAGVINENSMPSFSWDDERLAGPQCHDLAVAAFAQLHTGCPGDEVHQLVGVKVTLSTVS
jgi:hypothetical protein